MKIKVKKIGDSTGLILPKELLAELNVSEGDSLYATLEPGGVLRLSPNDPHHAEVIETARDVLNEYRDTFEALAK